MGRVKKNLKYQLMQTGLKGLDNNRTVTSYKRHILRFAEWCKTQNIRDISSVTAEIIQQYEEHLAADPRQYTPATIHKLLAPVCRAAGVNLAEIRKPKRTSGTIIRGRLTDNNRQGKRQEEEPRFSRLVQLQKAAGIRRTELAHLTGKDFDGTHIHVARGKGGKEQYQFILPEDRETVRKIFEDIAPNQRVFSPDEMKNLINLHGMRAEHARRCYSYYLKWLQDHPGRVDQVREALLRKWEAGHKKLLASSPDRYEKQRRKFLESMRDEPYSLRGENRVTALNAGRPTEYNRLALMCVSVNHLAHWRNDVTVTNYMI